MALAALLLDLAGLDRPSDIDRLASDAGLNHMVRFSSRSSSCAYRGVSAPVGGAAAFRHAQSVTG